MKRPLALAGSAATLLAGSWLWLALYPALPRDLGGVESLERNARCVRIPTADGDSIDGWFLRGRAPAVVLLLHGHGRTHQRLWRYGSFLHHAGYSVLAIDFRSSRSWSRKPTTLGHFEQLDARAALAWVRAQPELRRCAVGVLGESLGGTIALLAAAESPAVRAVVDDSGFATGAWALEDALAWAHVPAPGLGRLMRALGRALTGHDPGALDARPAATALAGRAVLFIHGLQDRRIRPAQTRLLWRAAGSRHPLWLIPDAGHNQGWARRRTEYEARVMRFFERHLLDGRAVAVAPLAEGGAAAESSGRAGRVRGRPGS